MLKFLPELHPSILSGQKTQHREPLDPQPEFIDSFYYWPKCINSKVCWYVNCYTKNTRDWFMAEFAPHKPGDRFQVDGVTFEVVTVRVERLQEISHADAVAEGIEYDPSQMDGCKWLNGSRAIDGFARLWGSIYGDGDFKANGWVWVYTFRRVEGQP